MPETQIIPCIELPDLPPMNIPLPFGVQLNAVARFPQGAAFQLHLNSEPDGAAVTCAGGHGLHLQDAQRLPAIEQHGERQNPLRCRLGNREGRPGCSSD